MTCLQGVKSSGFRVQRQLFLNCCQSLFLILIFPTQPRPRYTTVLTDCDRPCLSCSQHKIPSAWNVLPTLLAWPPPHPSRATLAVTCPRATPYIPAGRGCGTTHSCAPQGPDSVTRLSLPVRHSLIYKLRGGECIPSVPGIAPGIQ